MIVVLGYTERFQDEVYNFALALSLKWQRTEEKKLHVICHKSEDERMEKYAELIHICCVTNFFYYKILDMDIIYSASSSSSSFLLLL